MAAGKKRKAEDTRTKVLIVDDHPILRQGLGQTINLEKDFRVCGEAETAQQALEAIETLRPDIAIVDITLKNSDGIDLIKDIKARHPKLPVLVLSMHDESLYAERALRAGARGYIMKHEPPAKVIDALRQILAGSIAVSPTISQKMLNTLADGDPGDGRASVDLLSDRELQIFKLTGQGHGRSQVAKELHLSVKTIEAHRANIQEKLKLKNSAELLQYAIQYCKSTPSF